MQVNLRCAPLFPKTPSVLFSSPPLRASAGNIFLLLPFRPHSLDSELCIV